MKGRPYTLQEAVGGVERCAGEDCPFWATGGRRVADATGLSVHTVLEARATSQTPISLDEPVLPDGSPLAALVADSAANDPALATIAHEQSELLARALAELGEQQRRPGSGQVHPESGPMLVRAMRERSHECVPERADGDEDERERHDRPESCAGHGKHG